MSPALNQSINRRANVMARAILLSIAAFVIFYFIVLGYFINQDHFVINRDWYYQELINEGVPNE